MTGFEPQTCGNRSDCSTNWATTTTQKQGDIFNYISSHGNSILWARKPLKWLSVPIIWQAYFYLYDNGQGISLVKQCSFDGMCSLSYLDTTLQSILCREKCISQRLSNIKEPRLCGQCVFLKWEWWVWILSLAK